MQSRGGARTSLMYPDRVYYDPTPYVVYLNLSDFSDWSQDEPAYIGEYHNDTAMDALDVYTLDDELWNTVETSATVDYSLAVGPLVDEESSTETAPTECPTESQIPGAFCEAWWKITSEEEIPAFYEYEGLGLLYSWKTIGTGVDDDGPHPGSAGAILEDIVAETCYVIDGHIYVRVRNRVYPLKIVLNVDVENISLWAEYKFTSVEVGYNWYETDECWLDYNYVNRNAYWANWTVEHTTYNGTGYELVSTTAIYSCYDQLNETITLYEAEPEGT